MTKNEFKKLIITEANKILLNEDISAELEQSNRQQGNHLAGNDEIGEFYIVVHPVEGDVIENVVKKVSIPHLLQKIGKGELQVENIHSILKKDTSANRYGKKILKEFNQSLQAGRKSQLEEMQNKRKGYQMRLDGYKILSKGKEHTLDEGDNIKLKKLEEYISIFDNKIAELQKKIDENKKSLNESVNKKEELRELFGFGASAETKYMTPEEKKQYLIDKETAKRYIKGGDGEAIGKMLKYDKRWVKVFEPFFPKMTAYTAYRVLREAPNFVGWFYDNIKYKQLFDRDRLSSLANIHPELDKVFTEMGLVYYKPNHRVDNNKSINEPDENKEELKELFGFGKKNVDYRTDDEKKLDKYVKKETPSKPFLGLGKKTMDYRTPDEIRSDAKNKMDADERLKKGLVQQKSYNKDQENERAVAKLWSKQNYGKKIGQSLVENFDRIQLYTNYIPKMSPECIRDIIIECPKSINFFQKVLPTIGYYYAGQIIKAHPELTKAFDAMGIEHTKNKNGIY